MRDPAAGLVPSDVLFGAAVSAAGEGGFNGPGQPENQWWAWEHTGRATAPGLAGDVWGHPEAVVARAAEAGCEVLALPVEWARVEPSPGEVDAAALERYARILAACGDRGIVPMATLHDLAHPGWLGGEFWLTPGSPDRFAQHAARVVRALGGACRHWVTLLQPNLGALAGWVGGHNPPGRVGAVSDAWAVLDNLFTAHVLAYDAIHELQPDGVVAMGMVAPGTYDWHRLPLDLMLAPALGVDRQHVDGWVEARRRRHDEQLPPGSLAELVGRRLAALLSPYGERRPPGGGRRSRVRARRAAACPRRLLDSVYGRAPTPPLDGLALVWSPGSGARSARPDTLGQLGRLAGVAPATAPHPAAPWEAPVDIEGLGAWCRDIGAAAPGVPLWVQAGVAMPPGGGARLDGWDRPSYLRAVVAQVVELVAAGTPIAALCYRDLGGTVDRAGTGSDVGLFSVAPGPEGDGVVWREVDGTGAAAGEAFRRLVAAVRAGDRPGLYGGSEAAPGEMSGPPAVEQQPVGEQPVGEQPSAAPPAAVDAPRPGGRADSRAAHAGRRTPG